jgi:hypothetical protein
MGRKEKALSCKITYKDKNASEIASKNAQRIRNLMRRYNNYRVNGLYEKANKCTVKWAPEQYAIVQRNAVAVRAKIRRYKYIEIIRERDKIHSRKRRAKYPEKVRKMNIIYSQNWRDSHKEESRIRSTMSSRKRAAELRDSYVVHMMCRRDDMLNRNEIPPELIELKRKQLKLIRHVKNVKNNN